jgi:hypothetical protein
MFSFLKKKNKYPPFNLLTSFHKRNAYFTRTAEWAWLDNESIFITNPVSLEVFRPTGWPQDIFINANGAMTVAEYVHYTASRYSDKIPYELDQIIIMELIKLSGQQLITFVDSKQKPGPDFELPKFFNVK